MYVSCICTFGSLINGNPYYLSFNTKTVRDVIVVTIYIQLVCPRIQLINHVTICVDCLPSRDPSRIGILFPTIDKAQQQYLDKAKRRKTIPYLANIFIMSLLDNDVWWDGNAQDPLPMAGAMTHSILFHVNWRPCSITRCDMAFIEPMHRNKPNITYLLTVRLQQNQTWIWDLREGCLSKTPTGS